MEALTFLLLDTEVLDRNSRQPAESRLKHPGMFHKQRRTNYSVRSVLLGTLIGKRARVSLPVPVDKAAAGSLLFFLLLLLLTMSNDREVARALNSLVREGHALFGSCDSHALSDFVAEYLCGDDSIDSDGK